MLVIWDLTHFILDMNVQINLVNYIWDIPLDARGGYSGRRRRAVQKYFSQYYGSILEMVTPLVLDAWTNSELLRYIPTWRG